MIDELRGELPLGVRRRELPDLRRVLGVVRLLSADRCGESGRDQERGAAVREHGSSETGETRQRCRTGAHCRATDMHTGPRECQTGARFLPVADTPYAEPDREG